ncbi:MAG: ABC transporter ATP-binding protein [bacterium]|nr:ABC transporter ATP-binding protein [bacterium]
MEMLNRDTFTPLISVRNLKKYFPIQRGFLRKLVGYVRAVDDVNLEIEERETLGLVGESGSGKSTLGRTMIRLYDPTDGQIFFRDGDKIINLTELEGEELRKFRKNMQIIFQDPFSSLNERMTVLENVGDPLIINGLISSRQELIEQVVETLQQVGLRREDIRRYPHSFSGGQRQRICIARALILKPKFIVCDEPVSALDVSIQAQILNLLKDLQEQFGITYLFISHDISVVRYMADRIAVMYAGRLVEVAPRDELLTHPLHPYTEALLSAVPRTVMGRRKGRAILTGDPPDPANLPTGCVFHVRCRYTRDICKEEQPNLRSIDSNHHVSCHLAETLELKGMEIHV